MKAGKQNGTLGRIPAKGYRSIDEVAKIFKVSRDSIQKAKALLTEAADLASDSRGLHVVAERGLRSAAIPPRAIHQPPHASRSRVA